MSAYLDASVLLPEIVGEPTRDAVDAYISKASETLLVSDFAAAEVASGLSRLMRMRVLSPEDVAESLADFDAWRAAETEVVDMLAADARLANILVRRFELRLRAPDALHVAIARRLDATLVTLDRRLAAAAREMGVMVIVPSLP